MTTDSDHTSASRSKHQRYVIVCPACGAVTQYSMTAVRCKCGSWYLHHALRSRIGAWQLRRIGEALQDAPRFDVKRGGPV